MAFNLSGIVEYGRLINKRDKSTHGWLKLKGEEMGHMFELTGDLGPGLKGKTVAFWPNPDLPVDPDLAALDPESVHPHQVGPTGRMYVEWSYNADSTTSAENDSNDEPEGSPWQRRLQLEWFSQNGRVVIDLLNPLMEELIAEDGDEETWAPMLPPDEIPSHAALEEQPFDAATAAREAIPYGHPYKAPRFDGSLYSTDNSGETASGGESISPISDEQANSDINSYLDSLSAATDRAAGIAADADGDDTDDELMQEMIYMDEVVEGKHDGDAPLNSILSIGVVGKLTDQEAELKLKEVLAILALHGFAIHICKHFSTKDTLRIIRDDYAVESRIHPGLMGSGWTTNFNTAESCATCDAEWEEEHKDMFPPTADESPEQNPSDKLDALDFLDDSSNPPL